MTNPAQEFKQHRAASRRCCEQPGPDGSMRFYRMAQLWGLATGLPVQKVPLSQIPDFDDVVWFGGPLNVRPTCRAIAEHARDMHEAELSYPIILSPNGVVLDGMHRICKAYLLGKTDIDAVRLPVWPPYRWRLLPTGEEQEIA